jgi:hypothetical protein
MVFKSLKNNILWLINMDSKLDISHSKNNSWLNALTKKICSTTVLYKAGRSCPKRLKIVSESPEFKAFVF